ncbi:dihydrokaempferol 4-reductase [Defluviimonas sp. 20V17]|uniref:Dihydroflavonol-4-reductase n=1 Tax=Allgaiera indica TaxID=765699 RepID=A0AAN4ZYM0_9RHOB|nr:NAD-dependent epimerase/dehydratase family protein [Allgaiera indica]KDB03566.1 dihydrokaempferol 4-reductase [Defluviimonas sp. 20V17]GHD98378.1 dihydroflavonol-4-reductase [Allgaiera indica]SDW48389.1 dihydroflavonol-4-reductase [Allgaiera indica]
MSGKRIVLTGISGYIAKHIALRLLNAGHSVTGSVRSPARMDEVRAALAPHLTDPAALERLRFATLDLTADDGWTTALKGAEVLVHTASPFPISQPRDPEKLIRPAVNGSLRALAAARATGVKRVVLTSSVVAIATGTDPGRPYTEDDWTDVTSKAASAYARSKTLAERAAWDIVREQAPHLALTTINPAFVLGPPLDRHYGASVGVVKRMLSGKDPMVPRIGFAVVDVRDVAEMHLRAVERPDTTGRRYIAADRALWFAQMAAALKDAFPDRKIATRTAPDLLMRALGLFDPAIRSILPQLGRLDAVSNARARQEMGMTFLPAEQSLVDTARYLVDQGLAD